MPERMRRPDPVRPAPPPRPGWHLDPWGDGERYWDGEIWTRRTRELADPPVAVTGEPDLEPEAPVAPQPERPRTWPELEDAVDDDRPMRSGLVRGMIWAFAVAALLAMLLTAVSIWPMLRPTEAPPAVPVLHSSGSFTGSAHG